MVKKNLFAAFGLAIALAFVTPPKAHAQVSFGVTIGGPVYVRPVRPYPFVYAPPVVYPPAYVYPQPYFYPGPVVYGGYYRRPYWRAERFERREHFEHRHGFGRDRR
jgi:hypothetical protein